MKQRAATRQSQAEWQHAVGVLTAVLTAVQAHHDAASGLAANLDVEEHLRPARERGGISGQ